MQCWFCSAEVPALENKKVGFSAECPACRRPAHCCLNCRFYAASAHNNCREANAERVVDKEKNNYCDYFGFSAEPVNKVKADRDIKSKLDELFK